MITKEKLTNTLTSFPDEFSIDELIERLTEMLQPLEEKLDSIAERLDVLENSFEES